MPILRAVPFRPFSREFHLYDGAEDVGSARFAQLPSRGTVTLRDSRYTIDGIGLLRRQFEFRQDGIVLYRLVPAGFVRFQVEGLNRTAYLKACGPFWRRFELQHGERTLCTVRPESVFRRAAAIDYGDDLPEPAAAFLLLVSILIWRRRARRAHS